MDDNQGDEDISDLVAQVKSFIRISDHDNGISIISFNMKDKNKSNDLSVCRFQEAIKSLADPLIPVRAFGLNILKGLVMTRDPVAVEKLDLIISIFLEQLADEDR